MALIAALLLAAVMSAALGGLTMIASIERRAAAAHVVGLRLRLAAAGALAVTAEELAVRDWRDALAGSGSATWRRSLNPPVDLTALTQALQRETMIETSHGADTPVWHLFAHMAWSDVSGHDGGGQTVVWVADDWSEGDADPSRDQNGLLLVRVAALSGSATAWTEGLCRREPSGRIQMRHVRSW
ncbi:MAG: hypothetical protein WD690_01230 [Vicinamibacterales bacterium]